MEFGNNQPQQSANERLKIMVRYDDCDNILIENNLTPFRQHFDHCDFVKANCNDKKFKKCQKI
jgi:hypothetical protein